MCTRQEYNFHQPLSNLSLYTLMYIENDKPSSASFNLIVLYQKLLCICDISLTCSLSKVLTSFGFMEWKEIQVIKT